VVVPENVRKYHRKAFGCGLVNISYVLLPLGVWRQPKQVIWHRCFAECSLMGKAAQITLNSLLWAARVFLR